MVSLWFACLTVFVLTEKPPISLSVSIHLFLLHVLSLQL